MITHEQLRGCHVALITPMTRLGSLMVIDYPKLYTLIDRCLDAGVAGLLFAGTTGQSATLGDDELIELCARGVAYARAAAQASGRTVACLVSAGSNATAQALDLSRRVIDGVRPDALLHVTGYYNNPPQEGLVRHFEAVADLAARSDTSVLLYNIPGRTGSHIEPKTMIRLAAHPAIAGVKDAVGDLDALQHIRDQTDPQSFALLSGEDHLVSPVVRLGGIGVISAAANRWPAEFQRLADLANAGDFAAADALQAALQPCIDAVFSAKNPIPLHAMFSAGVRLPLVTVDELDEPDRSRVRGLIRQAEALTDFPHMGCKGWAEPMTEHQALASRIDAIWDAGSKADADRAAVQQALDLLDRGEIRVAEQVDGLWHTYPWVKKAVLLYFRFHDNVKTAAGPIEWFDKVPLKSGWQAAQVRSVPSAVARYGSFIEPDAVLMPCFINIGARVGAGTMIDTWATVGSCAQIGRDCHISGGVGIGGVLEPVQAGPVIVEDGVFIGARSEVAEGVIVGQGAVLAMGCYVGASTRLYDEQADELLPPGRIPPRAVCVPGAMPSKTGRCSTYAVIIKKVRDERTDARTALNAILREGGASS